MRAPPPGRTPRSPALHTAAFPALGGSPGGSWRHRSPGSSWRHRRRQVAQSGVSRRGARRAPETGHWPVASFIPVSHRRSPSQAQKAPEVLRAVGPASCPSSPGPRPPAKVLTPRPRPSHSLPLQLGHTPAPRRREDGRTGEAGNGEGRGRGREVGGGPGGHAQGLAVPRAGHRPCGDLRAELCGHLGLGPRGLHSSSSAFGTFRAFRGGGHTPASSPALRPGPGIAGRRCTRCGPGTGAAGRPGHLCKLGRCPAETPPAREASGGAATLWESSPN